jgi:hypothetical protein
MRKIEIRVNYNVTLFAFVDSISQWDHFVSKHINKYFKENYAKKDNLEMAKLWQSVHDVVPILQLYQTGIKNKAETIKNLDYYFHTLV